MKTKQKCQLCSMSATHLKSNEAGIDHYYCSHHAPTDAVAIGGRLIINDRIANYLPVILIYAAAIALSCLLLVFKGNLSYHALMLYFMGFTFLSFGFFKMLDVSAFADGYQDYDIIAMKSRAYALAYPFIEIALAGLYLADIGGIYRDIFTLFLMIIGSIGVYRKLRLKEEIPCVCLGVVFKLPMTKVTLVENGIMAVMALSMIPMYFTM